MAEVQQYVYQFKRGTAERWMEVNPVLRQGEPGFEYDTGKLKIGDGFTPWAALEYITSTSSSGVYNAPTKYDFPKNGEANIIYKAELEATLYQWNSSTEQYEALAGADVGGGDGSNNTILELVINKGEDHLAAIQNKLNGMTPTKNDIFIIKEPIANQEYSFTAYAYDGKNWIAFDGNYNANNVYFDKDFIFTKAIGTISIPSSGNTTVSAAGKNLYEFFSLLFAQEEYPPTPITNVTLKSSNIGSYEVGTNININYNFDTNSGNYIYGPADNGVEWSQFSASFNGETKTENSGTFKSIQVTDSTKLTITGSCKNSDGAIPYTNLGNEYPEAQIQEKIWNNLDKGTLTGYRAWFCGYKNGANAFPNPTALDSADIRGLGNSANGSWKSSMKVEQMQQMFFAAPKGKGYKPVVKDHSTTAPQTVLGPIEVAVEGANHYDAITYEVWYVANAAAASGSATLDITKN